MRLLTRTEGQATVEVVALLPLVVGLALVVAHLLAIGQAREQAAAAARAAAVALVQGENATAAAHAAVPSRAASDVDVRLSGRRVTVRVQPRVALPGLGAGLAPRVSADAGDAR